jgi:hypothetical protein
VGGNSGALIKARDRASDNFLCSNFTLRLWETGNPHRGKTQRCSEVFFVPPASALHWYFSSKYRRDEIMIPLHSVADPHWFQCGSGSVSRDLMTQILKFRLEKIRFFI